MSGCCAAVRWPSSPAPMQWRQIEGGLLVQDADNQGDPEEEWRVVSRTMPSDAQWSDLRFAWALVRHVKSNAITVVKQKTLLGCGAGQMSRVDSVGIALAKAADRARGARAGFRRLLSLRRLDRAGGRRRDLGHHPTRRLAARRRSDRGGRRHGIAMIFTGRRHFKH